MSSAWIKCGAENRLLHLKPCMVTFLKKHLQFPMGSSIITLAVVEAATEYCSSDSSILEKYPSWPKGHPWKGCRRLTAAQGFKSLLLRSKRTCARHRSFFCLQQELSCTSKPQIRRDFRRDGRLLFVCLIMFRLRTCLPDRAAPALLCPSLICPAVHLPMPYSAQVLSSNSEQSYQPPFQMGV